MIVVLPEHAGPQRRIEALKAYSVPVNGVVSMIAGS